MTLTRPTRRLIWLLGLALLAAALAGAGCLTPPGFDEQAWRDQVAAQDPAALRAPHRDPETGAFFNPWNRQEKPWWELWRWFLSVTAPRRTSRTNRCRWWPTPAITWPIPPPRPA